MTRFGLPALVLLLMVTVAACAPRGGGGPTPTPVAQPTEPPATATPAPPPPSPAAETPPPVAETLTPAAETPTPVAEVTPTEALPPPPTLAPETPQPPPPTQAVETPAPPPTPGPIGPSPPADPRAQQITDALTRAGYDVKDVHFEPAEGNRGPGWVAVAAAKYAQPSRNSLVEQAFGMWGIIFPVVSNDPPQTIMLGGQLWTKYIIFVGATVGNYGTLGNNLRSATTDEERERAFKAFGDEVAFGVYDVEARQWVDMKDFVNKNFTE